MLTFHYSKIKKKAFFNKMGYSYYQYGICDLHDLIITKETVGHKIKHPICKK